MSLWEIILLGIIQGLTEFLPVSSSGHLVVANAILQAGGSEHVRDLVEVSIVLHLGTLAAVLLVYRREIARLAGTDRRVIPLLLYGTIPAAAIGIPVKNMLPSALILENTLVAGLMFPVTALVLLWISRRTPGDIEYPQLTWKSVLAIGCMQAVAIVPGISRSGFTIAAGLGVGLNRQAASTYAFLLAIPVIAGGGLLEGIEAYREGTTGTPLLTLVVGFVVSMIVGWAALKLLIHWVKRGQLAMFAWYLIPLGVAVIGWQMFF